MTNDTSLESYCALLLESVKKLCKFAKTEFFIAKCLQKKIVQKIEKLYIFKKPLTMTFQICKKICNILNNLTFQAVCLRTQSVSIKARF